MISFDLETSGLSPHNDTILLAQFCEQGKSPELIPNPDKQMLLDRLAAADLIVGHNLIFDFGFCGYIPEDPAQFDDTFFMSRLFDFKAESHSLDALDARGSNFYANIDKKIMQKADWSEITPQMREYAEADVLAPLAYYDRHKSELPNAILNFDKRSVIACLKIQKHGLPVDRKQTQIEIRQTRTELKANLSKIDFNPNSPKQCIEALGIPSTGDKFLAEEIADGNETAATVRRCRKLRKHLNFLEKLILHDRFYGTLKPNARSGRLTSDQENLQNLPRAVKHLIAVPEDRVIIAADFAQLELRTIAAIAEDETMLRLFIDGEDLHDYAAATMFGENFTKQQRQIAKTFNFSSLYGAGSATIRSMLLAQTGIALPEFEVAQIKREWLRTFHGIHRWQKQGFTRHGMGHNHRTPHGRPYASVRATDHLSIENQGAGAEVARIALHRIVDNLHPQAKLINFVHDSYVAECPNDPLIYAEVAETIYEAMKYAWHRAPFEKFGLDMPVQVGVARNWKDADSLENCIKIYGDEE